MTRGANNNDGYVIIYELICPAGRYAQQGECSGLCPRNTFSIVEGAIDGQSCQPCPLGSGCSSPGMSSCAETCLPSSQPSVMPSTEPSAQPSSQPVLRPTGEPSLQPSGVPTKQPWYTPTSQPTREPWSRPSFSPSRYVRVCMYENI